MTGQRRLRKENSAHVPRRRNFMVSLLTSCVVTAALSSIPAHASPVTVTGSIQYPIADGQVSLERDFGWTPDALAFVQNGCKTNDLNGQFAAFIDTSKYKGRTATVSWSPAYTIPWPTGGYAVKTLLFGAYGNDCNVSVLEAGVGSHYQGNGPSVPRSFVVVGDWIGLATNELNIPFKIIFS